MMSSWAMEHPYLAFVLMIWMSANVFSIIGRLLRSDNPEKDQKQVETNDINKL